MRGDAVDLPMGSEIEKEEKKALSRFCTLGPFMNCAVSQKKLVKDRLQNYF